MAEVTGGSTGVDTLVLVASQTTDTSDTLYTAVHKLHRLCTSYTDCTDCTHAATHTTTHTTTRTVRSRGDGKGTGRRHEIVGEEAEPIKHHCTACEAGEARTDDGLKKLGRREGQA